MSRALERAKTGIDELDRMLDGGLIAGSSILVQGAPGVGKTTLGLQFLYEGATRFDESGALITFEEFPSSLYRDAEALGWDMRDLERKKRLQILFTSPEVFLAGLQSTESPIIDIIQGWNVKRVVLDSVTMFRRVTEDALRLRDIYNSLINGLKRERVTSMLTSEDRMQMVSLQDQGKLGFVVDGIILMRYVEVRSTMQRALTILKMRGINHDRSIRRFEITSGGIKVREPFVGLEGILSGSSHTTAAR
jgi:circadian clock protein KaiC